MSKYPKECPVFAWKDVPDSNPVWDGHHAEVVGITPLGMFELRWVEVDGDFVGNRSAPYKLRPLTPAARAMLAIAKAGR